MHTHTHTQRTRTDRLDHSIDQHERRFRIVVHVKPGSIQLQQKLKTGMNVKATEGDRALSAFTAGSGGSMSADVIRLRAV